MTTRRGFLASMASALSLPSIARAQGASVLKFSPQSDVAILDPIMSVSYVTRNHALMIFDTLYGADEHNRAQPQMVEGHIVEQDGLQWTLTLRDGLRFHDGTPVLARDVVASLKRWWKRDNVGQVLAATTEELSAISDRAVRFRFKAPFPMLPDALGKFGTNNAVIMPERLALTEATVQVTEMVGSGPYRFVPGERVPGSRLVYEKFADYAPRPNGQTSALAGPKLTHFDRVEWLVMPDVATAASALQTGEIDWWEQPASDYWDLLAANRNVKLDVIDPFGSAGVLRFNFLQGPTSNVLVRRAALAAISQRDVMTAVIGEDPKRWRDKVGYFLPGTPMASQAGLDALQEPPDRDAARRLLKEAGYKGEPLVYLVPADIATIMLQGEVVTDALKKVGFNIDMQLMDWGTLLAAPTTGRHPTRAAGIWSGPSRPASACSTRRATTSCAAAARPPSSAGPTSRVWRNCAWTGSGRRTKRHRPRSAPKSSASPSRPCPMRRPGSTSSRRPIAAI